MEQVFPVFYVCIIHIHITMLGDISNLSCEMLLNSFTEFLIISNDIDFFSNQSNWQVY